MIMYRFKSEYSLIVLLYVYIFIYISKLILLDQSHGGKYFQQFQI